MRTSWIVDHMYGRNAVFFCGGLVVSLLLTRTPAIAEAPADQPDIAGVLLAWKSRQTDVTTAHFDWEEEEFCAKGTRSFTKTDGTFALQPPDDVKETISRTLKLDGQKMRYEYRGPGPVQDLGVFLPRRRVTVTDGQEAKSLSDKDESGEQRFHAACVIYETAENRSVTNVHIRAILLCYRPLGMNAAEERDSPKYVLQNGRVRVGDQDCMLLVRGDSASQDRLLVDPACDFVPVRWEKWVRGELSIRLDTEYSRDRAREFVPKAWRFTVYALSTEPAYARGKAKLQVSARVTNYRLKTPIPPSDFRIDVVPEGTLVSDERNREYYILRAGGINC